MPLRKAGGRGSACAHDAVSVERSGAWPPRAVARYASAGACHGSTPRRRSSSSWRSSLIRLRSSSATASRTSAASRIRADDVRRHLELPLHLQRLAVPHGDREQPEAVPVRSDPRDPEVILAFILFDRPRGWKIYRTLLFVPYVLSIPVVGVVFGYLFQLNGVVNEILRAVGLGFIAQDWLGDHAGRCRRSCS